MLDRSELKFNDDVVKMFEYLQVECWNPDYHFLTDKIKDEDYGWVYKSERVEDEFNLFLNILYSLKREDFNNLKVEYVLWVSY